MWNASVLKSFWDLVFFMDFDISKKYCAWKHLLIFHDFLVCKSGQVLANDLFDMMLGQLLAKGTCVGQKHCIFITFGHLAKTFSWLLSATWNPFEIWYFWWIFDIFQKSRAWNVAKTWPKANSDTWDAFAHRAKHVFGQRKHFIDGFDSWPNTYWSDKPLLGFWRKFFTFGNIL